MKAIGLDLGTTNSVIALNARPLELAPVSPDDEVAVLMPSAVSFPPSGATLVGMPARRRRAMDPLNTIVSSKRIIGEGWSSYNVVWFRESSPYSMVKASEGGIAFQTRAGRYSAEQIASLIVATLWRRASLTPQDLTVVVAVPTTFGAHNCDATRAAVARTGVQEVKVIHEPLPTALAYLRRSSLRYAVIYDLGGGTFDLSIIDCASSPVKLLAHGGDLYLGGDDIDLAIAEWAAEKVLSTHRWDLKADKEVFAGLVAECEQAKVRLSRAEVTEVAIPQADPAMPDHVPNITLDRATLWDLALPTVRRTFGLCDEVFDRAHLRASAAEAVFLAGGTTALPGFADYIGKYFDKRPRSDIDPMQVVAIGASMGASRADLSDFIAPSCS